MIRPSRAAEAGDEDRRAPSLPDVVPAAARRERHPRHRTRRQARRRRGQGHVAALASAWKLSIHPHTSMTGLNMAATIHFLAAIDNGGYFEADVSKGNLFRDRLTSAPTRWTRTAASLHWRSRASASRWTRIFSSSTPSSRGPRTCRHPPENDRGHADEPRAPRHDEGRPNPQRLGDRAAHERAERERAAEGERVEAHHATAERVGCGELQRGVAACHEDNREEAELEEVHDGRVEVGGGRERHERQAGEDTREEDRAERGLAAAEGRQGQRPRDGADPERCHEEAEPLGAQPEHLPRDEGDDDREVEDAETYDQH